MLVKQSQAVAVLQVLGVDTAASWGIDKLTARLNSDAGVGRYAGMPPGDFLAPELAVVYTELQAARQKNEQIDVVADLPEIPTGAQNPMVTKAKAKPKPKPKKARKPGGISAYQGFPTFQAWRAWLKNNPQPLPDHGVTWVIVRELKAAGTAGVPVTKAKILGVLEQEFKDRNPLKMETSIANEIVGGRLRWKYGIHVWRQKTDDGEIGYYIPGDGKTPQPKIKKPAVVKKKKPVAKKKVTTKVKPKKSAERVAKFNRKQKMRNAASR